MVIFGNYSKLSTLDTELIYGIYNNKSLVKWGLVFYLDDNGVILVKI